MLVSMDFRTSASSRRILILAMLAVIFHGLMPLWMALPVQTGVRMEMCSTLRAKSLFVKFDTSGKGLPDKDLQARCPLCLAGANFALMPPVDAQPAMFSGVAHVQLSRVPSLALSAPGWPAYHSRAPPVFSV
jgi:hypothetical protein